MANKYIKKTYLVITGLLMIQGCYKDLDFTGFIRSTDRVNERFTESIHWNNNNPHPGIELDTNNYSIMLAADCHVGTTNNLDKLLGLSKAPEISALFIAGDITTGKKEDYDVVRQKLNNSDSVSCFLIAGNHDLYFDGWKTFFSNFGSSTYTILIETPLSKDLYICLDTGGGTLGDKQLEWLKEILSNDRKKYRHCVVITHNNFFRNRFTTSTNPLVEELYVLLELFAEYKVNFVITGHDHKRYIEVFGPTTYITLDALKDGLVYASSLKLTVYNDSIIYQFIDM
jgi:predicted phosphodiesterase